MRVLIKLYNIILILALFVNFHLGVNYLYNCSSSIQLQNEGFKNLNFISSFFVRDWGWNLDYFKSLFDRSTAITFILIIGYIVITFIDVVIRKDKTPSA